MSVAVVAIGIVALGGVALALLRPGRSGTSPLERLTRRRSFRSADELFANVRELIAALERQGHSAPAAKLREGMGCLNGLTDGWALFLESIDQVRAGDAHRFDPDTRTALERIRADVGIAADGS